METIKRTETIRGTDYELELEISEKARTVTVRCASEIAHAAESFGWREGVNRGWKMHGGGTSYTGDDGRFVKVVQAYPAPKAAPARKRAPKLHAIVDGRVDVKLFDTRTTDDIFWSERCNSYVLAVTENRPSFKVDGKGVILASVNGGGEIRWTVDEWQIKYALENEARGIRGGDSEEQIAAARHFGLVPATSGAATQACFGRD